MKKSGTPRIGRDAETGRFTIGRARFEKISAIEGIALTDKARQRVADADRHGLSAEERRTTILKVHRRK